MDVKVFRRVGCSARICVTECPTDERGSNSHFHSHSVVDGGVLWRVAGEAGQPPAVRRTFHQRFDPSRVTHGACSRTRLVRRDER